MNRQRGLGLIELAIWALIAAAVVAFVIAAWQRYIGEPYRVQGDVRTETRLQPMIAGLTKQRDQEKAANKGLEKDVADLRASVTLVQIAWAKADKAAATAQAESRRLFTELAKAKAATAAEIAGLNEIINRPPSAELCGGICARARDLLLSFTAEPDRLPGQ